MEKEKTCLLASQTKTNKKIDNISISQGIRGDSTINIKSLLTVIQNEVQRHNCNNNQKLIGDIEVKFNCDKGIREMFGRKVLDMDIYFPVNSQLV